MKGRHPQLRELPSYGANSELLQRHGWSGLRFDGDESNHVLVPNLRRAFITPQNIVALFRQHNVSLDVDYVSIDVDSCDLWIFLALLTDVYRPTVVTIEYNSNYASHRPMNRSPKFAQTLRMASSSLPLIHPQSLGLECIARSYK